MGASSSYLKPVDLNDYNELILKGWMREVTNHNPKLKFRELVAPCSHDAASSTIPKDKLFSALSRTQDISIYQQLNFGARMLDLRYGAGSSKESDLRIFHGPHSGSLVLDVLKEILKFMQENPYEFIVLEIKQERDLTKKQRVYLGNIVFDLFRYLAISKYDLSSWFQIDRVTMKEIEDSGKRVLVLVDQKLASILDDPESTPKGGILSNFSFNFWSNNSQKIEEAEKASEITENQLSSGLQSSCMFPEDSDPIILHFKDEFLISKWFNTDSFKVLFDCHKNHILNETASVDSKLINSQLVLTNQSNLKTIKYFVGMETPILINKVRQLFEKAGFMRHFMEMCEERLNFVMTDFINFSPHLTKFMVGLNFNYRLQILKGLVKVEGSKDQAPVDVTSELKEFIFRGNSLWMERFEELLKRKPELSHLLGAENSGLSSDQEEVGESNIGEAVLGVFYVIFEYQPVSESQMIEKPLGGSNIFASTIQFTEPVSAEVTRRSISFRFTKSQDLLLTYLDNKMCNPIEISENEQETPERIMSYIQYEDGIRNGTNDTTDLYF